MKKIYILSITAYSKLNTIYEIISKRALALSMVQPVPAPVKHVGMVEFVLQTSESAYVSQDSLEGHVANVSIRLYTLLHENSNTQKPQKYNVSPFMNTNNDNPSVRFGGGHYSKAT